MRRYLASLLAAWRSSHMDMDINSKTLLTSQSLHAFTMEASMDKRSGNTVHWSLITHEGVRLHQHRQFLALPFIEKLKRLDEMCEVSAWFEARQRERENQASRGRTN